MTDQTAPTPEEKPVTEQAQAEVKAATEPPRKRHQFVRWGHKRRRLLTFIGALIVFGTFIIKDALRDNLRNLSDSISNGENMFLLRGDFSRVMDLLHSIVGRMDHNSIVRADTVTEKLLTGTREHLVFLVGLMASDRVALDRAASLLDKLPESNKRSLLPRIREVDSRDQQLWKGVADLDRKSRQIPEGDSRSVIATDDAGRKLGDEAYKVDLDVRKIAEQVLNEAKSSQQYYETRYKVATWASYFLYAIGWGLGLVGRLVGVETGAGE